MNRSMRHLCLGLLLSAGVMPAFALYGSIGIHDPSALVHDKDGYHVWQTGQNIPSKTSKDLILWKDGGAVFTDYPKWINNYVPKFAGGFWAPAPFFMNGKYHVYYAASDWGTYYCAIGFATSPTLDPTASNYKWTDQGLVVYSSTKNETNPIDPGLFRDTSALAGSKVAQVSGAALQLGAGTNATNQKFRLERAADGTFVLSPVSVAKAVQVAGANPANGTAVTVADYAGALSSR